MQVLVCAHAQHCSAALTWRPVRAMGSNGTTRPVSLCTKVNGRASSLLSYYQLYPPPPDALPDTALCWQALPLLLSLPVESGTSEQF